MANTTGIREQIYCPNGFYFGDPCYALDEKLYEAWIEWGRERERTEGRWCNDGKFCYDGKEIMVVDSTAYGDGCYPGRKQSYGVDAGCLAVIPLEYCTREGFEELGYVDSDYSNKIILETDDEGKFRLAGPIGTIEEVVTGETEEYEDDPFAPEEYW